MKKYLSIAIFGILLLFIAGLPALGANEDVSTDFQLCATGIPELSAVTLLETLAREKQFGRYLGGSLLLVSGVGLACTGFLFEEPEVQTIFFITGGVFGATSLFPFLILSPAEREYHRVLEFPKKEQEQAGYAALTSLAAKAKTERLISGITSAGLAVYYLCYRPYEEYLPDSYENTDLYNGCTMAASAVLSLLIKSREEILLSSYEKSRIETAWLENTDFRFGFDPGKGSVAAVVSFSY